MAALSETIRVRVEAETKAELEQRAASIDRKPGELARRYIRAGLERDGLVDFTPHRLRGILKRERDAGRAFGTLADAVRAELVKRGLPA
jgi:hypothetical protein